MTLRPVKSRNLNLLEEAVFNSNLTESGRPDLPGPIGSYRPQFDSPRLADDSFGSIDVSALDVPVPENRAWEVSTPEERSRISAGKDPKLRDERFVRTHRRNAVEGKTDV